MKVLMFGWEFPPNNLGGLGTACYGLTKGLSSKGVEITFVLPRGNSSHDHLNIITAHDLYIDNKRLKLHYIDSMLTPYMTEHDYDMAYKTLYFGNSDAADLYGKNLFEEVEKYALKSEIIAKFEEFDLIHCHDWMTFKAGIVAKRVSGKPLIVHIHSTDFDRTGGHPNQFVYDIEREGMHNADKIITVSNYTKDMVVKHYGIDPQKVEVVHNAVEKSEPKHEERVIGNTDKVVLFLGRLTLQKGPDYFIEAAHKVLGMMPDVKFVVAGSGEMYKKMVDKAAGLNLGKNVLFTGHLAGEDVNRAYRMADLYVMPSVSEPFGITPLESIKNNTPVLISKQSGVSEVLTNALKVDFWDIEEMTNKIVGVLSYSNMKETLAENGKADIGKLSWDSAAGKCIDVYSKVMQR